MTSALKLCPFCGGKAAIIEVTEPSNVGGYVVQCEGCEASTRVWFPIKDDVTGILNDAWNKRAEPTSPTLEHIVSSLEEEIENVEFGRALRVAGGGPAVRDDETEMPYARAFKDVVIAMRSALTPNEPSVPLSAIRALVQQWREKGNELCPDKQPPHMGWSPVDQMCRVMGAVILEHADQLAALCPPAPTEADQ